MYPLIEIGPLRLSSGGLLLLGAVVLWGWLLARFARARGGAALAEQAERCFYPTLLAAVVGGRLWYGLFNWDLYTRAPGLFVALRAADLAWPGALLGGMLAGYLWCRRRGYSWRALADCAALALPPAQALAALGQLLSGEAFGAPTGLPWAVELFGAARHPTQIYAALAAGAIGGGLWLLQRAGRPLPPGGLAMAYLGLSGLSMLLLEALRADALLLPGGLRATQLVGLGLLLAALLWVRARALHMQAPALRAISES